MSARFSTLTSPAIPLLEDDISTERIAPKGAWSNSFMTVAPEGAAILLAGRNFGAGPRPSAASEAIAAFGVDCVICVSAEATFVECAANRGILTAIVAPEVADDLADAAMNREAMTVDVGARIITTALGERHAFTPAAMFNGARRADRRREDAGGHWFVPAFA